MFVNVPVSSAPNALHSCTSVREELRWFKILAHPSSAIVNLRDHNNPLLQQIYGTVYTYDSELCENSYI